jgi:hypothetical protein
MNQRLGTMLVQPQSCTLHEHVVIPEAAERSVALPMKQASNLPRAVVVVDANVLA